MADDRRQSQKVPEIVETKKNRPRKSSLLTVKHNPQQQRKRSVTFNREGRPTNELVIKTAEISIDKGDFEETIDKEVADLTIFPAKVNDVKNKDAVDGGDNDDDDDDDDEVPVTAFSKFAQIRPPTPPRKKSNED